MRLELTIPDALLEGALRAAAARGSSLEAYMTNALELSLQDGLAGEGDSFFTDEVVAEIRAAQAEARGGRKRIHRSIPD